MKRFIGISATFLVVAVIVLLVIGCGGAPDSGTGTDLGTLSKDKQFQELDKFIDMDFSSEDALFDIGDIVSGQATSMYWDGVDSSDISGGPVMSSPGLASLGKISKFQAESLSLTYDDQSGWWFVSYSAQDDFFGIEVEIRDSVRFETLDGTPQEEPDASTYRVIEHGFANLAWDLAGDSGSFSLLFQTSANQDVTGLNTYLVTVDGDASGVFNLALDKTNTDESVDIDFTFSVNNNNVTVAGPEPDPLACPTGGTASAKLSLSIDVQDGDISESANGDWDVDVQFLGDGRAKINVVSGDFTHTATGTICE